MNILILFIAWCILLVLCWPVALLLLLLLPLIWLVSLPFRMAWYLVSAAFALVRALFLLPFRILGFGR